jgi:hypothetical protein
MIMNPSKFKSGCSVLMAAGLSVLLASCTESTNIASNAGDGVSSCSSLLGVTCVNGRFIDEAVENLDYECGLTGVGTVKARTDVDGSFSCPNNSVVTFSLTNPDDTEQKIVLGEVKVQRPADIYGDNAQGRYFYVSPYSLANVTTKQLSDRRALNIARLLHTMNTEGADVATSTYPSRRIIITMDQKRLITASMIDNSVDPFDLAAAPDADLANPQPGTFDKAVRLYVVALGKTQLISASAGVTALRKGFFSIYAGAYASGPTLLITDTPLDADFGNMVGNGSGADTGKKFLGQFWTLVDRRGRMIGSGIYSYGDEDETEFLWSNPQAMDLKGFGASGIKSWPYSDELDGVADLSGLQFSLLGASDAGKEVRITQGVMSRGAIAGSSALYENLFDEDSDGAVLGEWNLVSGSSNFISGAPYTFEHTFPATTLMNPDLWESAAIDFPIPLEINIFNTDTVGCPATKGCEIATIRALVLEDGNIVSDISDLCGDGLDRESLTYSASGAVQEYPLGLVANILRGDDPASGLRDQSGNPITVMTMLVMIPNNSALTTAFANPTYAEYFPYIQFGSNFGSPSINTSIHSLLRVDTAGGDQYQMYGQCNSYFASASIQMCTTTGRYAPATALWMNNFTSARLKHADSENLANEAELGLNNDGFIKSTRRTCS